MAKNKYGLIARLVWDGGDEVKIPEEMGAPAGNQMQGSAGERLGELSGRICYDSLGRGRSSLDYHKHILDVGHLSVAAHFHMTVWVRCSFPLEVLLNRPGVWTMMGRREGAGWRITFNPRSIVDWDMWSRTMRVDDRVGVRGVGDILAFHAERAVPMILPPRGREPQQVAFYEANSQVVAPDHEEEKWVSLMLSGSRGFSHEQVRHAFRCGISQRSTRYVDEDESPWIDHPLVQEFLEAPDASPEDRLSMREMSGGVRGHARSVYSFVAKTIQDWLTKRGIDKLTARKQARGAARGYLGNALQTELIFSASVGQWKRMLRLRCHPGADAEIRILYNEVLPELLKSRYAESFSEFGLKDSPDGFGKVAEEF